MTHTLRIELDEREGALMRLIGLVERRGFTIDMLEKSEPRDGQSSISMTLAARDGARRMDVLVRQIARLFDVRAVFTPEIAIQTAHAGHRWRQACPQAN